MYSFLMGCIKCTNMYSYMMEVVRIVMLLIPFPERPKKKKNRSWINPR
jgi:hypothetical protein